MKNAKIQFATPAAPSVEVGSSSYKFVEEEKKSGVVFVEVQVRESELELWEKFANGELIRKKPSGTETAAKAAIMAAKMARLKAWLSENGLDGNTYESNAPPKKKAEEGPPKKKAKTNSKKSEMPHDDPRQEDDGLDLDDRDEDYDPGEDGMDWDFEEKYPSSSSSSSSSEPPGDLFRADKSKYREGVVDRRMEGQEDVSPAQLFSNAQTKAKGWESKDKVTINGVAHFKQYFDVVDGGQKFRWKNLNLPDLPVIKELWENWEKYLKSAPGKKATEAERFLKFLQLFNEPASRPLLQKEMFSGNGYATNVTHTPSPTVLACLYHKNAFPKALERVRDVNWNHHCLEVPGNFLPDDGLKMQRANAFQMLRFVACHLFYKKELRGGQFQMSDLFFDQLPPVEKKRYLPLGPLRQDKYHVEVPKMDGAGIERVDVTPVRAACKLMEHMSYVGDKNLFQGLVKFKNMMYLAVRSSSEVEKNDTAYTKRLKDWLLNPEFFYQSKMYWAASQLASQNKEVQSQSNVATFFKSEIIMLIKELRGYMGSSSVIKQVAARALLVQLLTGSRMADVLLSADYFGSKEYYGLALTEEAAFESTKEDGMIVVAGVSKQKKKNAGSKDKGDDGLEEDLSEYTTSAVLTGFGGLRVETSRLKVLPAKPILFPNEFKARDIIEMVAFIRRNSHNKKFKTVYGNTQELWKATLFRRTHKELSGSHKLRGIYAVYSYDMYANLAAGEQDTLNAWINKVLGHSVGNFKTSLSYNTSSIKEDLLSEIGEKLQIQLKGVALQNYTTALVDAMNRAAKAWEDNGSEIIDQEHQLLDALGQLFKVKQNGETSYVRIAMPHLQNKTSEERLAMLYESIDDMKERGVSSSYSNLRQLGYNNNEIKAAKQPPVIDNFFEGNDEGDEGEGDEDLFAQVYREDLEDYLKNNPQ